MNSTFQMRILASAVAFLVVPTAADARPSQTARAKSTTSSKSTAKSEKTGVGKGDTELGFFADYTNYDSTNTNQFLLGANIGKFLRDNMELSITPVIIYS